MKLRSLEETAAASVLTWLGDAEEKIPKLLLTGARGGIIGEVAFLLPGSYALHIFSQGHTFLSPEETIELTRSVIPEFSRNRHQFDIGIEREQPFGILETNPFVEAVHGLRILCGELSFECSHGAAQGCGDHFQAKLYIAMIATENVMDDLGSFLQFTLDGVVAVVGS
jgi:hypothetical protein